MGHLPCTRRAALYRDTRPIRARLSYNGTPALYRDAGPTPGYQPYIGTPALYRDPSPTEIPASYWEPVLYRDTGPIPGHRPYTGTPALYRDTCPISGHQPHTGTPVPYRDTIGRHIPKAYYKEQNWEANSMHRRFASLCSPGEGWSAIWRTSPGFLERSL